MVLSVDNFENFLGFMLDEYDFVQSFDIGKYIWEVLIVIFLCSGEKNEKKYYERILFIVNLVFLQIVQCYGKGFVVYIDFVNSLYNGYYDNIVFEILSFGVNVFLIVDGVIYCKVVFVNVDIKSEIFDFCVLQV